MMDVANEELDAEMERLKAMRRSGYDQDLREMMSTVSGRRFMARVIEDTTGIRSLSFTSDTSVTAFNEGKRAVGIFLSNECRRVTPDEYILMHQEQLQDARTKELERHLVEAKAKKSP